MGEEDRRDDSLTRGRSKGRTRLDHIGEAEEKRRSCIFERCVSVEKDGSKDWVFGSRLDSQFGMVVDESDLRGGGTRKRRSFEVKKGRRVDRKGVCKVKRRGLSRVESGRR